LPIVVYPTPGTGGGAARASRPPWKRRERARSDVLIPAAAA
jgi:hypothetical protein